jgi:hypothetical protein
MSTQTNIQTASDPAVACTDLLGRPLHTVTSVDELQSLVRFLYDLLDWVDTADDMAKGNDAGYRHLCQGYQRKRHERITSDGYALFVRGKPNERGQSQRENPKA